MKISRGPAPDRRPGRDTARGEPDLRRARVL